MRARLALTALLLVLPLSFSVAVGQSSRSNITGVVVDSTKSPIEGATVVAMKSSDSTLVSFGVTKSDGAFRLRRVGRGDYILQVTFVGYASHTQIIRVENSDVDVGELELAESTAELAELTISSERIPMLVKSDTLEYNASAFKVAPNSNVEQLLKKLPGVEVERDGSIKALGEDVEKVLVDGKEFFGDDPKIATKNLPAEAVDKVQVYDKKSDMAEFTGIEDGEDSKTINLALKEDHKKGYFGNVTGGYGQDNRYDGKVNANRFSGSTQISVLANLNNVNQQGFSYQDYLRFAGGLNKVIAGGGFEGSGIPLGLGTSDGFSTTSSGGVNYNVDLSPKTSIRSSYFLNHVDNSIDRSVLQQQLLGSQLASLVEEDGSNSTENLNHRVSLNVDHKFKEGRDVKVKSSFQFTDTELTDIMRRSTSSAGVVENFNATDYLSKSENIGGSLTAVFRQKLGSNGRSLVAEVGTRLNNSDDASDLESEIDFFESDDLVNTDLLNQNQSEEIDNRTDQATITYIEPLTGQIAVTGKYNFQQSSEEQHKQVLDIANGVPTLNQALSANFDRRYSFHRAGSDVRWSKGDKLYLSAGAEVQYANLAGELLGAEGSEIDESFVHVLPTMSLEYEFRTGRHMGARYFASTREPTVSELNPVTDNRDPLNVFAGNPDLVPEYRHSLSGRYMLFDQFTFTNLFVYGQASYATNTIIRSKTIANDFSQTVTVLNGEGSWTINGGFSFGTPIRAIGAKLNLSNNIVFNRAAELVNTLENSTRTFTNLLNVKLGNRRKDVVDASVGAKYTFNVNRYSLNAELNQDYVNRSYYADLIFNFSDKWVVSSVFDLRQYTDGVFGQGENVALLGVDITRNLFGNRAQVKLVGVDLLDQNVGVNYTNAGTYIEEETVTSLGRYIMLKFVYNLTNVGGDSGVDVKVL